MLHQHFSTRSWLRIKRGEAPHWQISRTRWLKNLRKSLEEVAQGGPGGNSLNRQVWFFMSTKIRNCKPESWFSQECFQDTFFQKPGPCLLLLLLLSWYTWPLPQPSITWMSDYFIYQHLTNAHYMLQCIQMIRQSKHAHYIYHHLTKAQCTLECT